MGKFSARLGEQLSRYVQYLAWLNATPKPAEGTKRAIRWDASEAVSRMEQFRAKGIASPALPPNPLPHITGWLIDAGLTEAAGMGAAPISWSALDAWARRTGVEIGPWEARLLRRLSADYLAMSRKAESENCPPPWRAPVTEQERDTEMARLERVLG